MKIHLVEAILKYIGYFGRFQHHTRVQHTRSRIFSYWGLGIIKRIIDLSNYLSHKYSF